MTEEGHILVVENEDGDYTIEHPGCPTTTLYPGMEGFTCLTEYIVGNCGLDDLKENDPEGKLRRPGRYAIAAYSYTPQSMFEDAELYLYFDDKATR